MKAEGSRGGERRRPVRSAGTLAEYPLSFHCCSHTLLSLSPLFSAFPLSFSPLLPLKRCTRAASGPDSPVVLRWLLNHPQQKYRK
ncbi:hypothetical protein NQZ68_008006 [Dissostichus eleginoides]|nr:hypothetical protein NQZ68_008006 [Dissostichus eleginoides]